MNTTHVLCNLQSNLHFEVNKDPSEREKYINLKGHIFFITFLHSHCSHFSYHANHVFIIGTKMTSVLYGK